MKLSFEIDLRKMKYFPVGSKKIEQDRNWEIGKDRTFLSLSTNHFASLYLIISIFSYPSVYPPTEVASIFLYPWAYLPTTNFNLFLYLSWPRTLIFFYSLFYLFNILNLFLSLFLSSRTEYSSFFLSLSLSSYY